MAKKAQNKTGASSSGRIGGGKHLGDYSIALPRFEDVGEVFKEFDTAEFKSLNDKQKNERVNTVLPSLIRNADEPAFLLAPVIDFINRVVQEKVLDHFSFSTFELWLNQFSGLSPMENYHVRSLIVGKWIPREDYQLFFPVGMGKTYPGSHFVTAHSSPDLDTTVASFWGWVDAFAARVSEGLHVWNLPGGAPTTYIEIALLFNEVFGDSIFTHLAKTRTTLAVSGLDLVSQKGIVKKQISDSAFTIEQQRNQHAVVLVDESGYYLGDWRPFDIEGVRQIVMLLSNCLQWFEKNLHVKLISLFGQPKVSVKDLPSFTSAVLGTRIADCEPAMDFTEKQRRHIEDFLQRVLKVKRGLNSTFKEFAEAMKALSLFEFQEFIHTVDSLSSLFDKAGHLVEDRPKIFNEVEKIILGLDRAIQSVDDYVERLGIALSIKSHVFGFSPQVISYRSEVDEIRSKMGSYPYLTVTLPDREGRLIPLGVVHANEIHKPILGTVTLRDFCNREETKIPSYLEVISVIDHHKSSLSTFTPPSALISDAQSSNALVAEVAFEINDKFGRGGMTLREIEEQIKEVEKDLSSPSSKRVMQRLLQRHLVVTSAQPFFIDPFREFIEYLHFLYAILDDTDLLTKVSLRDVECVASLVNRLKSLMVKKEVEVVSFDGLKRDETFVQEAARRLLQNNELYSLYRKIYLAKEKLVDENLKLCAKGETSSIFADTKEQNGCCRVGQTKMFARNFSIYSKYAEELRELWLKEAQNFYKERNEFDLYIQMISTVAGAEDLFAGTIGEYDHRDELWIWIPFTEQSVEHLKSFLNALRSSPQLIKNDLEAEFIGENAKEYEQIFTESFIAIPHKISREKTGEPSMAILRFKAGSINSRKAMISPYLPRSIV